MSDYLLNLRSRIGHDLLLLPSVAAVIHDSDGRLLLQQKANGTWSLPAGMIEPGETPQAAVIREVLEETGISVTSTELVDVFGGEEFRFTYENGDAVEYVVSVFRCEGEQTEVAVLSETVRLKYWTREEFPGLALSYPLRVLFPDCNERN